MNQSLDGYVDHMAFAQAPRSSATSSRRLRGWRAVSTVAKCIEVMRYWDDDHPEWNAEERAFAAAWRNQPKWVVSRSLKSVAPTPGLLRMS